MGDIEVIHGDCLDVMPTLEPSSIDLILCDLPYGTTACAWDVVIPFEPLWANYRRLLKQGGMVVLTASQPFTSMLVMSNREWFRYSLVWDKVNKYTDFLNAKIRPLRRHEDVLVFAPAWSTYNPQMQPVTPYKSRRSQPCKTSSYGKVSGCDYGSTISEHNPCSVIAIESHFTSGIVHPTQKPVELFEYLIRTYSNPDATVLDNCIGSGTTALACLNTGRKCIGIEKDRGIYETALRRIARPHAPRIRREADEAELPLFEQATA